MVLFPSEQITDLNLLVTKHTYFSNTSQTRIEAWSTGVEWYERLLFGDMLWVNAFLFLLQILMNVASHLAKTVASAQIKLTTILASVQKVLKEKTVQLVSFILAFQSSFLQSFPLWICQTSQSLPNVETNTRQLCPKPLSRYMWTKKLKGLSVKI